MAGSDAEIAAFLDGIERELDAEGVNARVQRAYFTVVPLLMEADAVASAIIDSDDLALSSVLVVMGSVREAVAIADAEYRLAPEDRGTLTTMLIRELSKLYEG